MILIGTGVAAVRLADGTASALSEASGRVQGPPNFGLAGVDRFCGSGDLSQVIDYTQAFMGGIRCIILG